MSNTKNIHSSIHDYTLFFEKDLSFLPALLQDKEAIFIIDKKVAELYSADFSVLDGKPNVILLDAIEENKTLAASEKVFDGIIQLQPTKKTKIISIGGGITQDVSGFVASTFYRGLKWTYIPTTLLAQADSCMGSKTSLNYKSYKNILGTFYPPHEVYIAASFTNTLSEEDFYSGMGEVAKLHVMGGVDTLELLINSLAKIHERDIDSISALTRSSLDIKWSYMDGDEFDQGKRNMLNYGHDYGHAIETATHYKIPHGQAVILGMILANDMAAKKQFISSALNDKIKDVFFSILKSDYRQLGSIDNSVIINAMKQDKKRVGNGLPLIMMNEQFELFKKTDITEEEANSILEDFMELYCK
jgi:3-dehydroquinate synthase